MSLNFLKTWAFTCINFIIFKHLSLFLVCRYKCQLVKLFMLDNISYWLGTWISPLRSLLSNYFQQKQVSLQHSQSLQTLNDFLFDIYMVLRSSSSQTKQHSLKTRYRYIWTVCCCRSQPTPALLMVRTTAALQHCSSLAPLRPRTEAALHTPQLQGWLEYGRSGNVIINLIY